MFKKVTIALICIMSGGTMFAQKFKGFNQAVLEYYTRDLNQNTKQPSDVNRLSSDDLKNIKGSPYANSQFILGDLYKGDSLIVTKIPMRYNIASDQIELNDPKDINKEPSAALIKSPDISIRLLDNTYRYKENFITENGVPGSYFSIVWEGDRYSLYKKMNVTYRPPYKATTSFDNDRLAEFTQLKTFYLVNNKEEFTELPSRKSALYKVLGDKKKEIKEYIEQNDLKIDEERDLAKLVKYYNSLL